MAIRNEEVRDSEKKLDPWSSLIGLWFGFYSVSKHDKLTLIWNAKVGKIALFAMIFNVYQDNWMAPDDFQPISVRPTSD